MKDAGRLQCCLLGLMTYAVACSDVNSYSGSKKLPVGSVPLSQGGSNHPSVEQETSDATPEQNPPAIPASVDNFSAKNMIATPAPTALPTTAGIPAEISSCSSKTMKTETFKISFPATQGKCLWENVNTGLLNAHLEQTMQIPVKENWVMCSMGIEVANGTSITYDDTILFAFNDRALIGTKGLIDLLKTDSNGLHRYEWSQLRGKSPLGELTCPSGATECFLPQQQTEGAIKLKIGTELIQKLMSLAFLEKKYELKVVTTGDNDFAVDCAHSGLPLLVNVSYYEK